VHAPAKRQVLRVGGWIAGVLLCALAALLIYRVGTVGLYHTLGFARRPTRHTYSHEAYEVTKARANALIAALESRRRKHGEYPEGLEELVPGELPSIQRPIVGEGLWEYRRIAPDRFALYFFVGGLYESDQFDSARGDWYVDR
jgi:hypothetical protein